MRTVLLVSLCLVAIALPGRADKPANARADKPANAQFEKIKSLVGEWRPVGDGNMKASISLRLVSNGTAIMETSNDETHHAEMITIYHLDGDHLMLTHYCAANNQPRMQADPKGGDKIVFAFKDATNLAKPTDMHMHGLALSFPDDKHLTEEWTSMVGGKEEKHVFQLVRSK